MKISKAISLYIIAHLSLTACTAVNPVMPTIAPTFTMSSVQVAVEKAPFYSTIDILGIGPVYAARLKKIGIRTVKDLLEASTTPKDRQHLLNVTGIGHAYILKWANYADLMRITGVGPEYSRLLETAGVDTVIELLQRNPVNLRVTLETTNAKYKFVERIPSAEMLAKWIKNSQTMQQMLVY